MKRFNLTAAGLAAAAICGAASADISIQFNSGALGAGGVFGPIAVGSVSGTLTSFLADITFTNLFGDSSWASDMLVAFSDGTNAASAGGFNLNFGVTTLGGWNSGASSASGNYSMMAANGTSVAMNGLGNLYIANGYSASSGASYSGKITLKGLNYVPAPGAIALLGLAGLRSRRRR
ncbi:MAG: hypothetical protein JNK53_07550 [Phycisphaerae bacterium]|nr:hypothetical protein [Phycisphaerae bacterium]